VVKEQSFLERLQYLMSKGWFRKCMHRTHPAQLVYEAKQLQTRYMQDFWDLVDTPPRIDDKYEHKRYIHALRRYASRLIYLAPSKELPSIAEALFRVPELELYAVVFDAIASGDVSDLVVYGANAAQSAVYPLLSSHKGVVCNFDNKIEAARQAKAIFVAHGLKVLTKNEVALDDMERFCEWDVKDQKEVKSPKSYFSVLASLHGLDAPCRHKDILFSAFDTNEDMITDMSSLLNASIS
jgi:hypothetical protein